MSTKYTPAGTAHENTLIVNRVVSECITVLRNLMCHMAQNLKIHRGTRNTLCRAVLRRCNTLTNHLINQRILCSLSAYAPKAAEFKKQDKGDWLHYEFRYATFYV